MLTSLFQVKLNCRIVHTPHKQIGDMLCLSASVVFFLCSFTLELMATAGADGIPSTRKTPEHELENVTRASVDMGREANECILNLSELYL